MTAEELIKKIEEARDNPREIIALHERAERLSEEEKIKFRRYPYNEAFGMEYISYKKMEEEGTLDDYIKNRKKRMDDRKAEIEKLFIKH